MFKVGDTVYSLVRDQNGIVVAIHDSGDLPMRVFFEAQFGMGDGHVLYTKDGRYLPNGGQVLFHGKPTIIPPKRKVTKYCWAYLMPGTKFDWRIVAKYFANEAEVREWLAKKGSLFDNVQIGRIPGSEEVFEEE